MPDPGVVAYVRDVMRSLGVEVDALPEHWLPVGILGTLDWVMICGWWIWRNTGFFDTDEGYKFIIVADKYEFDPDMVTVFREDRDRNKFRVRFENPGIEGLERTEALQFLREDAYGQWARSEGHDPEAFTPPQGFLELVMWSTFLWVLSEYGRDWMHAQDELLACIIEFGVAYLQKWEKENPLLDPTIVTVTNRPVYSCRYCKQVLWCVRGAFVNGDSWEFVCNSCLVGLLEENIRLDLHDERLIHPRCPHKEGLQGSRASCTATCPHSGQTPETLWKRMEEGGSARLEQYREAVRVAGASPRQLAGQTLEGVLNHFREEK